MRDMAYRLYKSFQEIRKKTSAGQGGLVEAEALGWPIGESIVEVLKQWFSSLSKPKSIHYDNSNFTARVV